MKIRLEIYLGGTAECWAFFESDSPADLWVPAVGDPVQLVYDDKGTPYEVAEREHLLYPKPGPDDIHVRIQIFLKPREGYEDGSELIDVTPWEEISRRTQESRAKKPKIRVMPDPIGS